jgi:hypothetical protein
MKRNRNYGLIQGFTSNQPHSIISSCACTVLDRTKRLVECTVEHALHLARCDAQVSTVSITLIKLHSHCYAWIYARTRFSRKLAKPRWIIFAEKFKRRVHGIFETIFFLLLNRNLYATSSNICFYAVRIYIQ